MSHDDDILKAVSAMTDRDLNTELARVIGVKTLPSLRGLLDRLRSDHNIETKVEPCEDPDDPKGNLYRVYIKPLSWTPLSVTSISMLRTIRIALLVWLRYDASAATFIRKSLRISEK